MNFLRIFLGAALACLSAGCQTGGGTSSAAGGARFIVAADRTAFYERGPAQDYGPDFNLTKGQEVEMVASSFGFSRVKTSLGKVGYVSTDDLEVAPPLPDPTPTPARESSSSSSSRRSFTRDQQIDYSDVVSDVPLPEDEPKPVTSFRY